MLASPVAFIVFNRPDKAARVLQRIAEAKPSRLFVFADGPRPDHPDDIRKCRETRALLETVGWDCEVLRNYSDVNLGCGRGPARGISWVFEHTDRAIILEDDCVPDPTFFDFCDELLERYLPDERVMQIAGNNHPYRAEGRSDSYFFSMHNLCAGGWATWRRAWARFDHRLSVWPEVRETSWIERIVGDPDIASHYRRTFERAYLAGDQADYWDYQWTFACWMNHGLTAIPRVTLLTNIGFGPDSTHTKSTAHPHAFLPSRAIEFPLQHPRAVYPRFEDIMFAKKAFGLTRRRQDPRYRRALRRLRPRSRLRHAIARVRSMIA